MIELPESYITFFSKFSHACMSTSKIELRPTKMCEYHLLNKMTQIANFQGKFMNNMFIEAMQSFLELSGQQIITWFARLDK